MDRGAWQATVHGVTKSRTWLKWLSPCFHYWEYSRRQMYENPCLRGPYILVGKRDDEWVSEIYSKWVAESDTEKSNTEAETGRIRVGGGTSKQDGSGSLGELGHLGKGLRWVRCGHVQGKLLHLCSWAQGFSPLLFYQFLSPQLRKYSEQSPTLLGHWHLCLRK